MSRFSQSLKPAAGAVALAFALSGCQLLGIGGHGRAALRDDSSTILKDFGADQLAQGRQALVDGRTMEAIDAFMIAKSFPEQAPAAFNGLAVAYSRLGRTDLTERFFQTAIALAPEEDKYRTNLALFYSRNAMPPAAAPALAIAQPVVQPVLTLPEPAAVAPAPTMVAAASTPSVRVVGRGVTVQSSSAKLQRVSATEVHIGSAPATRVAHQPVIHVGRPAAAEYPVRITLSEVGPRPAKAD